jgi:hypothetical protein
MRHRAYEFLVATVRPKPIAVLQDKAYPARTVLPGRLGRLVGIHLPVRMTDPRRDEHALAIIQFTDPQDHPIVIRLTNRLPASQPFTRTRRRFGFKPNEQHWPSLAFSHSFRVDNATSHQRTRDRVGLDLGEED